MKKNSKRRTKNVGSQSLKIKKPSFFVQYYSTTDEHLVLPKGESDLIVSGKIANIYKDRATLSQIIWVFAGFLLFLGRIIYISVNHLAPMQGLGMLSNFVNSNLFWMLLISWLLILLVILGASSKFRKIDANYRMQTKDYQGTYLPNKYVEINTDRKPFDIQLFADVGIWQLVTDDGNGNFYYRLQTLYTDEEIEKKIREKATNVKNIKITKWLGSFYLPIG